ncbi:MAG TPA: hypothetical protein VEB66_05930 [Opitutaceae bacterium]|nr:hypothetical protein [Opitutaceae bacterium]
MHSVPEALAVEARARIMWGEPPEKIRAFLASKNLGDKDVDALIEEVLAERAASIRSDGFKKLWLGGAAMAMPFAYYYITHAWLGFSSHKLFAAVIVVGVLGLLKATTGLGMVVRPRAVRGDLANANEI